MNPGPLIEPKHLRRFRSDDARYLASPGDCCHAVMVHFYNVVVCANFCGRFIMVYPRETIVAFREEGGRIGQDFSWVGTGMN